jgi:hypothetical protein
VKRFGSHFLLFIVSGVFGPVSACLFSFTHTHTHTPGRAKQQSAAGYDLDTYRFAKGRLLTSRQSYQAAVPRLVRPTA